MDQGCLPEYLKGGWEKGIPGSRHSSNQVLRGGKAWGSPAWLKHRVHARRYGLSARRGGLGLKAEVLNVRLRNLDWKERKLVLQAKSNQSDKTKK